MKQSTSDKLLIALMAFASYVAFVCAVVGALRILDWLTS